MSCRYVVLCGAIALCTGIPSILAAQQPRGTVGGVVLNAADGKPIPDASVGIPALGRYVTSDPTGRFRIAEVAFGSQLIEARALGFQPMRQVVTIIPGDSVTAQFSLKAAAVTLPEVVVSSSREEQTVATTPVSIGVIEEEEIRETRSHHPSELVNRTPGVYVSNFGGEGHATAIRQPITTKAIYAYLEDGVPIRSTGFFNHNALYEINIPQAGRIEIIKGPGTAIYGSDAVGGVFNVFTRDPSENPEAELFVEGGSSTYLRTLGTASATFGGDGFRADLNVTSADGWRDDRPTIARAAPSGGIITSATRSPQDRGRDLSHRSTRRRRRRPYRRRLRERPVADLHPDRLPAGHGGPAVERDPGTRGTVVLRSHAVRALQRARPAAVLAARLRSADLGEQAPVARSADAVPPLAAGAQDQPERRRRPGVQSRQPTRDADPAGPSGLVFTGYTVGEVQYDYDVTYYQVAPYAQADVALPARVNLSAGVRYDHLGYDYTNLLSALDTGTHRRPASTDVGFDRLSPKLGATWEAAPSVSLFASYREAFRAPSESQLFRQGAAENTVDLKPVRAFSWDGGIRAALGGTVTVEATAYSMRLRDDILTFFDPATGLRLTQNAGATNHRGVELGLGLGLVDGLQLDAAVSYAKHTYVAWQPRPTLDYSGNEMELAPRFLGNARLTYRPTFLASGMVAFEWTRLGSYWMDPENTHKYDGHNLFNVYATVPVTPHVELSGRVTNLADARFAETSSFNAQQGERFRPGPPRQLYLGAQYRFGGL